MATNGIIHEINDVINTKQMKRTPATRQNEDSDESSEESSGPTFYSSVGPRRPFQDFFPF